ncbi:hypothetical protein EFN20_03165 [Propionibacterium freudenreichii]|uniref:Uncharacterized protein n=1 Tax=Propionibacterium freudenreichii subsp. shermanii (strain ATCC 9614 / DSM 4902 / CIP 103027 / NCIMB 8099 / CIRM-BIA1) TaxID=754252 RepID=D7GG01_PROFC|nr:hypothetical protein [Propionibacterium freudenreichii]PWM97867.1 MAG: hypothetical protein DBX96_06595 [Propionibacterium sp.]MCQ1998519.1 hypothetical protein [Propionibacterium freudenreichii]MCT3004425.1 hypothetical protein [Propionibacterium freudenreichii]MCT3008878.1 hypothetical protein [Propionibacterium freudenreichii]MDK9297298.1 hypothetical protein [Propionibacterium freudenreichii]
MFGRKSRKKAAAQATPDAEVRADDAVSPAVSEGGADQPAKGPGNAAGNPDHIAAGDPDHSAAGSMPDADVSPATDSAAATSDIPDGNHGDDATGEATAGDDGSRAVIAQAISEDANHSQPDQNDAASTLTQMAAIDDQSSQAGAPELEGPGPEAELVAAPQEPELDEPSDDAPSGDAEPDGAQLEGALPEDNQPGSTPELAEPATQAELPAPTGEPALDAPSPEPELAAADQESELEPQDDEPELEQAPDAADSMTSQAQSPDAADTDGEAAGSEPTPDDAAAADSASDDGPAASDEAGADVPEAEESATQPAPDDASSQRPELVAPVLAAAADAPEADASSDDFVGLESTTRVRRSLPLAIFSFVVGVVLIGIAFLWWRFSTSLQASLWLVLALAELVVGFVMLRHLRFVVRVSEAGISNQGHSPWALDADQIVDAGVQPGKHPTLWVMPTDAALKQPNGYASAALVPKGAKLAPLDPAMADVIERALDQWRFAAPRHEAAPAGLEATPRIPSGQDVAPASAPDVRQDGTAPAATQADVQDQPAPDKTVGVLDPETAAWLAGFDDPDEGGEHYVPRYARPKARHTEGVPMADWPTEPMRALTPEYLAQIKAQLDDKSK